MPSVVDTLERAIRERRPVVLEYRFRGQGLRIVHPHALYQTPRGLACDVFQVAGYTSENRTLPGWRALNVDEVISAVAQPGRFELASGYNPDASRYADGVIAPPD